MRTNTKKMVAGAALAGLLAAGIVNPFAAEKQTFTDVPTNYWAFSVIDRAYTDGAVGGMTYNEQTGVRTYEPEGTMTFAQFSNIIARSFYADELKNTTVKSDAKWWQAAGSVCLVHNLYYIDSEHYRDAGCFNVDGHLYLDGNINRYNMAHMMVRLMEDKGVTMPTATEISAAKAKIGDWSSIPEIHQEDVAIVFSMGLIGGMDTKGTFAGDKTMTRAQAAAIYGRLKDKIEGAGTTTKPVETTKPEEQKPTEPVTPTETEKTEQTAATGKLANGKDITEANVKEILAEIKEEYPEGMKWDETNRYVSSAFGGGGGCNAFAAMVSDRIYGENAPLYKHQNFDEIKVGDVVWWKNSANDYSHAVVVTGFEVTSKGYPYITDCSGNDGDKVSWNGYGYPENLTSECVVYSRTPVDGVSASKGW